jgi:hypothetical protein
MIKQLLASLGGFARGTFIRGTAAIEALAARVRALRIPQRHPFLLSVLVAAWFLYAFGAYLPALMSAPPLRLIEYYMRHTGAYDVLLALWLAAVAYCAGKHILRLLGISCTSGTDEAVFSLAAGIALFSWLTMLLSVVHGLYRPVAYTLLVVPTAIWYADMRRLPGNLWRALTARLKRASWSASTLGQGLIAAYVCVVLGVVLISALGPSLEYDDLTYHLAGPKNFVQNHRFVPLPDVPLVFFPKNLEMLYTLGLLLHSDATAKLVNFLLGAGTMLAVYAFSIRFLTGASGMMAAAILAASPLFIHEMRTAHTDLGLAFYVFVGIYATVLWLRTREAPWLRFAGLCLAFSMGLKYWALLALGVTALLAFVARLRQTRSVLPAASATLRLGLYSSLGLLPWGLVNLYYTGNPVFPLLNGVFQSPYWTGAHTNMALNEMFYGGIRVTLSNWWDLVRLWWELMADQHGRHGGNIGPFYAIFIPIFLLISKMGPEVWFLLASSGLYYVGWAAGGPCARFLLPALPGFAVAAALAASSLLRLFATVHRTLAIAAAAFLGVLGLLASPFFESSGSWARYGSALMDTLPLKYLAGRESKSEYLARYYQEYQAIQYLNQIPGPKKVFYAHTIPDGYYLDGKAAFHYSPYAPGLFGQSADYIHRVLRKNGVTHVAVGQVGPQASPLSSRESPFAHEYLRKLYQRNAVIVYQLLPNRIVQDVVAYDLVDHLEEARMKLKQPGRRGRAFRGVRSIGSDSRYAMVTAPPAEVEFTVTVPYDANLSFAVGKDNLACTGRGSFQVWISSPESGRRIVYGRDLEGESGAGWIEEQVDLAEYGGQRVAIAFKTEEVSPSCDYLWADPVLIARDGSGTGGAPPRDAGESTISMPVVTGASITPIKVHVGEGYTTAFRGTALTSETYFDVRFLAPGSTVDEVACNWQRGTSGRHTLDLSTRPGKWIITGVRAHRDPWDHKGGFTALLTTLEVAR